MGRIGVGMTPVMVIWTPVKIILIEMNKVVR